MKLMLFNKKGFSLAEVVISLGVAATVMIVAIGVTSQSLRLTKENEVENTANEILIQTLELAKSPVPLNVKVSSGSSAPGGLTGSYALVKTENAGETGNSVFQLATPFVEEIDSGKCTSDSEEYRTYGVDLGTNNFIICNQIIFDKVTGSTDSYKITSIVIYEVGGEKVKDKAEAFRNGNFNVLTQ